MNVFVLCTGRCGSMTFARAWGHVENFTAAHESKRGTLGPRTYPEDHIEVDNSLSWVLGRLDALYGEEAFYVHLKRKREDTVQSFMGRAGIVPKAYGRLIGASIEERRRDVCEHYYDTVNQNIELFLKDKPWKMNFSLASAQTDFREFWDRIDANGNLSEALEEWKRNYNASDSEAEEHGSLSERISQFPIRAGRKITRVVRKLPGFLSRA